MSHRPSIVALADDLTGAAEIASIGRNYGLSATVALFGANDIPPVDLLVLDTDSRLAPPAEAARRVETCAQLARQLKPALLYKKVDSVLRGPVLAELAAFLSATAKTRLLLVPANPSLGRTIRNGHYFINNQPLHETAFARDPHHPATSSDVLRLLGPSPSLPVRVARLGDTLAASGIVVGEVSTLADVEAWIVCVNSSSGAAGGADFFRALLAQTGARPTAKIEPPTAQGATLIISGSTVTNAIAHAERAGLPVFRVPEKLLTPNGSDPRDTEIWIRQIGDALRLKNAALAVIDQAISTESHVAPTLSGLFSTLAQVLHDEHAFRHLIVGGGATAAAVLATLGWTQLDACGEWAPGVVALRPKPAPEITITLKPGSYAWPEMLWAAIAPRSSFSACH